MKNTDAARLEPMYHVSINVTEAELNTLLLALSELDRDGDMYFDLYRRLQVAADRVLGPKPPGSI